MTNEIKKAKRLQKEILKQVKLMDSYHLIYKMLLSDNAIIRAKGRIHLEKLINKKEIQKILSTK